MRFALAGCLLLCLCRSGYAGSQPATALSADSNPSCGYLGIGVEPVTLDDHTASLLDIAEGRGLLVVDVQEASAASKAGIKEGDVILEFEGHVVNDSTALGSLVSQTRPGRKVHLTILRLHKKIHVTAMLAAKSSASAAEPLAHIDLPSTGFLMPDLPSPALRWQSRQIGIEYEGVDSQLAEFFGVKQGVLIRFVFPGSLAQRAGLKAGDVLVKFNGKGITSPRDLAIAFEQQRARKPKAQLEVVRDRKQHSIQLPLGVDDSLGSPFRNINDR